MKDTARHDMSDREPWVVPRPTEIVQTLSPRFRWEITRRHPYYLMFWKVAQTSGETATEAGDLLRSSAQLILQQINVSDEPPPPSRGFDELDENELASCWKEGAIAPVQIRTLVTILVGRSLSNETKRAIADLLNRSINIEAGTQQEYDFIYYLRSHEGGISRLRQILAQPHCDTQPKGTSTRGCKGCGGSRAGIQNPARNSRTAAPG